MLMDEDRPGRAVAVLIDIDRVGGLNAGPQLRAGRRSWSAGASILLLASVAASLLATSSAPTPLYASYARAWQLSAASTSLAFGVYALSLLAGLLLLGRLSDHLGRRPVLLTAMAVQIIALAVFATAGGIEALLVGRVLQGISTAVGVSAVGAALLDVDTQRGTVANSVAPAAGSAIGAMTSALAVQFLPAPTRLIYGLLAVALAVQALALARLEETSQHAPGVLASLRPQVRLPVSVRGDFAAAAPVLFAIWALTGLFGSLGPALVHQLTGSPSVVLATVPLTLIGVLSPFTAYRLRESSPRSSLALGVAGLLLGVAVTVVAVLVSSGPVLFAAAVLAGVGFGAGFRGSIQLMLPAVQPGERAGTLSSVYIVSYLGFGVPAIIAGIIDAKTRDVSGTTLGYSGVLILLALIAAIALRRTGTRRRTPTSQDR